MSEHDVLFITVVAIVIAAVLIIRMIHKRLTQDPLDEDEKYCMVDCPTCGDGEYFHSDWPKELHYSGPDKKVEGTNMVCRHLVYKIICPDCKRRSRLFESFEKIPAPRFNYMRHL